MDPEYKAKWIAALRSGDYKQTQGTLRRDEACCCLGVLCSLVPEAEWKPTNYSPRLHCHYKDAASSSHLPFNIRTLMRISVDQQTELISLNDNDQKSFAEIATYIEENL